MKDKSNMCVKISLFLLGLMLVGYFGYSISKGTYSYTEITKYNCDKYNTDENLYYFASGSKCARIATNITCPDGGSYHPTGSEWCLANTDPDAECPSGYTKYSEGISGDDGLDYYCGVAPTKKDSCLENETYDEEKNYCFIGDAEPEEWYRYEVTLDAGDDDITVQTCDVENLGDKCTVSGGLKFKNGYDFLGWDVDNNCNSPLKYNYPVTSDTTLYTCWSKTTSSGGVTENTSACYLGSDGVYKWTDSPSDSDTLVENYQYQYQCLQLNCETDEMYSGGECVPIVSCEYTVANSGFENPYAYFGYTSLGGVTGCCSDLGLEEYSSTQCRLKVETKNNAYVYPVVESYGCSVTGDFVEVNGNCVKCLDGYTFDSQYNCVFGSSSDVKTYKITYDANGGNVTTKEEEFELGESVTLPTAIRDGHTFNGWYTDKTGGLKIGDAGVKYQPSKDTTLYAQWTANSSGGDTTTETKTCVYSSGVYSWKVPETNDTTLNVTESVCLNKNNPVCIKTAEGNEWGIPAPNSEILTDLNTQEKCFGIKYTEYYTVKYNLAGGAFANKDTSRTDVVSSTQKLVQPQTNPIKSGYKFVGWYNGSTKFTGFNDYITKNYELTAHYERIADTKCSYTCNSNDVYDPVIKKCMSVNVNNNSFGTISTTINLKLICKNSVATYDEDLYEAPSENKCTAGYTKEYWISSDTCKLGGKCVDDGGTCTKEFKAFCYKTYDAIEKCSNNIIDDDGNATDNPQTGDIVIALVWFFGLAAIGYAFYYFKSIKQN